jgi:hypothetical protein
MKMRNPLLVERCLSARRAGRATLALAACAVALGVLALSAPAQAADGQFVGIWNNADSSTNHIVQIDISGSPGSLDIRTFGRCSPTPCDWGTVSLTTYGNNVSDTDHDYAAAVYNFGFETTLMTMQLSDPQTLIVDSYTQFLDGSGRQDYHVHELFHKVVPVPKPPVPHPWPWPFPIVVVP